MDSDEESITQKKDHRFEDQIMQDRPVEDENADDKLVNALLKNTNRKTVDTEGLSRDAYLLGL
jgi:hypothetical protein